MDFNVIYGDTDNGFIHIDPKLVDLVDPAPSDKVTRTSTFVSVMSPSTSLKVFCYVGRSDLLAIAQVYGRN